MPTARTTGRGAAAPSSEHRSLTVMPSRNDCSRSAYRRSAGRCSTPLAASASNRLSIRWKYRLPGTSSGSIRITVCPLWGLRAGVFVRAVSKPKGPPVSAQAMISISYASDAPLWRPNARIDPPPSTACGSLVVRPSASRPTPSDSTSPRWTASRIAGRRQAHRPIESRSTRAAPHGRHPITTRWGRFHPRDLPGSTVKV
jgi:hypothetical protein